MPTFDTARLLPFVTDVFAAMGTPREAALLVADHLLTANLTGHDSHGLIRVKQYREHVRSGTVDPKAEPVVVRDRGATALIDGNKAWGQVTAGRALETALAKAREHGASAVSARGCYHVGRAGAYVLEAARRGFIALLHCNGHGVARVAPWGGTEAKLSTNPLAVAVPTGGEPVLVDITTSVVAEGKVRLAKNAGKPIPEGWVLDKQGRATTNPADLYDGGTLLPLGGREGHKGYGLSIIVDLLGGVLSGAGAGFMTRLMGNGLFLQVVDPECFGERREILERVDAYVAYLKASATKPGVDGILLPGEPELRAEARRRREGVEIDDATWREVTSIALELGVAPL